MGVYIKGMEMPCACVFCELYDGDLCWCQGAKKEVPYSQEDKRAKFCPLVEVPDHGDLIEAHSLKIRLGQRFSLDKRRVMEIVRETVDTAKVVIPADKEEV